MLVYFWGIILGSQCRRFVFLQTDLRPWASSAANAVRWCPIQRQRARGKSCWRSCRQTADDLAPAAPHCVSHTFRPKTCSCWWRRWRTGPTGCSPNCSSKTSSTEWRSSARRRKCRWERDVGFKDANLHPAVQYFYSSSLFLLQTCLKRIRLDMPLTHEDYTSKDGKRPKHTLHACHILYVHVALRVDLKKNIHTI